MIDLPIDVSSLSELVCARRYQFRCVFGIVHDNSYARWGSALHKCIERKDKGENVDPMELFTELLARENLSKAEIAKFTLAYLALDSMPRPKPDVDTEGHPLIEWKFAFPFAIINDTRIVLCGTIDRIDIQNDLVRVIDYKTSRRRDIHEALLDFRMRLQIPFYMLQIKTRLAKFFPLAYQELLAANKLIGQVCGIFISYNPPEIRMSSQIHLTQECEDTINRLTEKLVRKAYEIPKDTLAEPEGMAFNICLHCPYNNLCVIRDAERLMETVKQQKTQQYNPLEHR